MNQLLHTQKKCDKLIDESINAPQSAIHQVNENEFWKLYLQERRRSLLVELKMIERMQTVIQNLA